MLQQSISNLMHKYGSNYPGVCAVIGVEKNGIESMPNALTLMQQLTADQPEGADFFAEEIILKDGYQWLDISKDVNHRIEFNMGNERSGQGLHHPCTVAIVLPNDDFDNRGKLIRAYDNTEMILIVKQRTGAWRVIGSMERGAIFSAQLTTGSGERGSNEYTCGWQWEAGAQRPYYTKTT